MILDTNQSHVDDISQANGPNFQSNIANMEKVFLCARTHNITFNFSKLDLFQKRVKILGNVVTTEGIQPDPKRIAALRDFKLPLTKKGLQSFIGLYNSIAKSMPRATTQYTRVLNALTKGTEHRLKVTLSYEEAFKKVKVSACKWILMAPFDPRRLTILQTDSSGFACGGLLTSKFLFTSPIRLISFLIGSPIVRCFWATVI